MTDGVKGETGQVFVHTYFCGACKDEDHLKPGCTLTVEMASEEPWVPKACNYGLDVRHCEWEVVSIKPSA